MFPVAAACAAGWLLVFFALLVIPPRERGATPEPTPGAEPPAVVRAAPRAGQPALKFPGPAGPGVRGARAQVTGGGYRASFRILILINVD